MQIYLRLNVARLLARVQKHLREIDSEVDVVRAAGPLPSGHLLLQLRLGRDFVGVDCERSFETFVDDERAVDDVGVEKFLPLLLEAAAE